ncbi:MAG: hypothetical protein FWB90_05330 [Fibromonadales bacterium]|nr:hypothetical protein [Fibromonadales bacterium]
MPILLPLIFIFLTACSDTLLYNEATPHISIDIISPLYDTVIVVETQSVYFRASINPPLALSTTISRFYWDISSRSRPYEGSLRTEFFADTGYYKAYFYAVDILGDTLKSKNITIGVSKALACGNLGFECIDGTANFKWECNDIKMTYDFSYKYRNFDSYVTTLDTNFLQLPENYQLRADDWEVRIIATNRFGLTETLNLTENTPCY